MVVPWLDLTLFIVSIGLLALYGLAWSGHFPADYRSDEFKTTRGAGMLWGTLVEGGQTRTPDPGIPIARYRDLTSCPLA